MTLQTLSTFEQSLEQLERDGLKRELRELSGSQGAQIIMDGKRVLNFCSNNYLGLADHRDIKQAAIDCINQNGFGSGASRLISGNMTSHKELEARIAKFKGTESCLVFSTGYMANVGIIASLFGRCDMIYSDRLNHASIIDGINLSKAQCKRYPHCDMKALEQMLKAGDAFQKRCIITDSVFSMDGNYAPLDKIVKLAQKYNCMVMIDEAHAVGVMGKHGRGLAEHFGVEDKIDIQMGTLSKAVGTFGAYCAGSSQLISILVNKARSFIYTTAMPPSSASASLKSIDLIEAQPELRSQLWNNTKFMHKEIKQLGFNCADTKTPIIPILIGDSNKAVEFSRRLFDQGIFVSAIRPPSVPQNTARLRLTVMATHTANQLKYAIEQLDLIGKELCLI